MNKQEVDSLVRQCADALEDSGYIDTKEVGQKGRVQLFLLNLCDVISPSYLEYCVKDFIRFHNTHPKTIKKKYNYLTNSLTKNIVSSNNLKKYREIIELINEYNQEVK